MKAAYHHPRIAARVGLESRFALVRPWARRPQAAVMPAAWVAASRSLRGTAGRIILAVDLIRLSLLDIAF